MLNVVTVASGRYILLVPFFINSLNRAVSDARVTLLVGEEEEDVVNEYLALSSCIKNITVIGTPITEGLPSDDATQGCAKKLRIWEWIESDIEWAIFLDIDTVPLGKDFLSLALHRVQQTSSLGLARDSYVGFKEHFATEFSVFNRCWEEHQDSMGRRLYVNTGFIICSRNCQEFFQEVLTQWKAFYQLTRTNPSIWDQNIFNYCLDTGIFGIDWNDVLVFDENYNALKEYATYIDLDESRVTVNGLPAQLLHFNGGDILTKLARRSKAIELILF